MHLFETQRDTKIEQQNLPPASSLPRCQQKLGLVHAKARILQCNMDLHISGSF